MRPIGKYLRNTWQVALAVLVLALVPAAVDASGLGYQNTAPFPVYVQTSITVNGQIKRGPLLFIKPGQTAWDVNLAKGNHTITVYSASNQVLYQNNCNFQGVDQFYHVLPARVQPRQPPRVDLTPAPLPKR